MSKATWKNESETTNDLAHKRECSAWFNACNLKRHLPMCLATLSRIGFAFALSLGFVSSMAETAFAKETLGSGDLNSLIGGVFDINAAVQMPVPHADCDDSREAERVLIARGSGTENTGGGGGHTIRMPDGKVVSADPFAIKLDDPYGPEAKNIRFEGKTYRPSPEVRSILDDALALLKLQCERGPLHGYDPPKPSQIDEFRKSQIDAPEVQFIIVKQLPDHPYCRENPTLHGVPANGKVNQSACTIGNMTLLLESDVAGMSKDQFAKLLLHERLRNWNPPTTLADVAAVTTGVQTLWDLRDKQAKGDFTSTSEQTRALNNLHLGLYRMRLGNQYYALPNGPANPYPVPKDFKATTDLASRFHVNEFRNIGSASIRNSQFVIWGLSIGDGAVVRNSKIGDPGRSISIGDGASITDSTLSFIGRPEINGKIDHADLSGTTALPSEIKVPATSSLSNVKGSGEAILGERTHMRNVKAGGFSTGDDNHIENYKGEEGFSTKNSVTLSNVSTNSRLLIGSGVVLQDAVIDSSGTNQHVDIGDGVSLKAVKIQGQSVVPQLKAGSQVSNVELLADRYGPKGRSDYFSSLVIEGSLKNVAATPIHFQKMSSGYEGIEVHFQGSLDLGGKRLDSVCPRGQELYFGKYFFQGNRIDIRSVADLEKYCASPQ